jgi:hypothetical protein
VFFLHRFTVFNVQVLASVVSVVAGGVITVFLGMIGASEKLYSWVGYCVGLALGVIAFGVLKVGAQPELKSINTRSEPESKDPRLQMLDELHERYSSSKISFQEFHVAKQGILSQIGKDPTLRKSGPKRGEVSEP